MFCGIGDSDKDYLYLPLNQSGEKSGRFRRQFCAFIQIAKSGKFHLEGIGDIELALL